MSPDHTAFAQWDGAYVMGALSVADRRAYEDHLAQCEVCRAAVAELAPLPGLLARAPLPAPDQELDDEGTASDGGPRADLVELMARRLARRRLRQRIAVGVVMAAAVVAAIVVPLALRTAPEAPGQTVALAAAAPTGLQASVELTPADWGTRLVMECEYVADSQYSDGVGEFALVVTDAAGEESQVSTWTAAPGDHVRLEAATAVPAERIATIEVRTAEGATLLVGQPGTA